MRGKYAAAGPRLPQSGLMDGTACLAKAPTPAITRPTLIPTRILLPNGNPPRTEKYAYKLKWMDRILEYTRERLLLEEPLVLAGDFNVIPAEIDVHDPALWLGDALFLPQTRAKFRALAYLGLTDAVRAASDDPGLYTFWDYQAGAWQKNNGIRIDHLVLSPQATDRLNAVGIDKHVRSWEKPSDHVPVWADFAIEA